MSEKKTIIRDLTTGSVPKTLLNFAAPLDGASFTKAEPDYGKIRALAEQSELKSILQ